MKLIISLPVIAFLIACNSQTKNTTPQKTPIKDKVVIAYVAGWNKIIANDIPTDKLTHINYAFADIVDGKVSEGKDMAKQDSANYAQLHLAKKNAKNEIKLIGSVGGWTWSGNFSEAASTPEGRKLIAKSSVAYINKYNLDGIDFDWEYPCLQGNNNPHKPEDKENFVAMLKAVRDTLNQIESQTGKHYITSIASGGFDAYIDTNNIKEAAKYLDYINIMTYDFHGAWEPQTNHHTNLYSKDSSSLSADRAVKKHIEAGVPANQLVLGIAFYGRAWKSVEPNNNGLYQTGKDNGQGYSFYQIDSLLKSDTNFQPYWDSITQAPFIHNSQDSIFITYENEFSVEKKCQYVHENNLKGVMFWELSEDKEGKLLQSINKNLE